MNEHVAIRQCGLTRAHAPKTELFRLSLGPDGSVFVDVIGRAPGRGAYVVAEEKTLRQALSKKGLSRLFRGKARLLTESEVEAEVGRTRSRLEARILELVGLARRAGELSLGSDAVLRALDRPGDVPVVVAASDASDRTIHKIESALPEGGARLVRVATKRALGRLLGRDEVSVVAIRRSKLADRILTESLRLSGIESAAGDRLYARAEK